MTTEPDLRSLVAGLTDDAIADLVVGLPPDLLPGMLEESDSTRALPPGPAEQAAELDPGFNIRPHIAYLSERIAQAVKDVEAGKSRRLLVSMPPRVGKSTLCTQYTPIWILRQHPDWDHVLVSHEGTLAVSWGRAVRRTIEQHRNLLGIGLALDAGAVGEWETTAGGGVLARTWRGSLTGRGAKVMVIDDPVKDFVEAHSALTRQALWDWWLSVAQTRLEPASLVICVMTRWHESDFAGRLLSDEHEGEADDWEVIKFPAFAEEETDALGRKPGEPLLSPLINETPEEALTRWEKVKRTVGSYSFSAMFQQHPAPAKGIIFDPGWWRYWTTTPSRATTDGQVVYMDPADLLHTSNARWIDSWDCAFKGTDGSDYVVGQRWVKHGPRRYLIAQSRGRRTFTATLKQMQDWADPDLGPVGSAVTHEHLVEDKANGTAVIDVMKEQIAGLIPINPTNSKEARARAVTPECEAGNVYLPHPADPGNGWVQDFLDEMQNFPRGAHDDQVDAATQALSRLRDSAAGVIGIPGGRNGAASSLAGRRIGQTALQMGQRKRG